jgi:hypothetical protein
MQEMIDERIRIRLGFKFFRGAMAETARRCNLSYEYVAAVLDGKRNMNLRVLNTASEVLKEREQESANLRRSIVSNTAEANRLSLLNVPA